MASPSTEQVRGVYVSANNVGYVPLNNYPNTTEYSFSDVPVQIESVAAPQYPVTEAAAPAAEPRRCFFRRCCRPVAFPRLACSSRLFLILALILAAVSLGGKRWYSRSFTVEADDPMAAQLGYSIDYRESIGLFKVCYHLKASPVPNVNGTIATEPIDHKDCIKIYDAFGRGHMPHPPPSGGAMGGDQSDMPPPPADGDMLPPSADGEMPNEGSMPPPPEGMPMPGMDGMGPHHGHHSNHRQGHHGRHGKRGCKGGVVFCAVKGVLIASFVFSVLAYLFTCIERRGCCVTRKRGVIITQPVFAGLAFLAILAAVIFAAAGSVTVVTKPPSAPLASVLNGPMVPVPLHFRFSCSFFLALGSLFFALLSTVLFTVRSARLVQQLSTAPAVPSS